MIDPFVSELMKALSRPLPVYGSIVTVDGSPAVVLGVLPLSITCTVGYRVDFGYEVRDVIVNDWDSRKPLIEVVA